jgi:hypothetical protein
VLATAVGGAGLHRPAPGPGHAPKFHATFVVRGAEFCSPEEGGTAKVAENLAAIDLPADDHEHAVGARELARMGISYAGASILCMYGNKSCGFFPLGWTISYLVWFFLGC